MWNRKTDLDPNVERALQQGIRRPPPGFHRDPFQQLRHRTHSLTELPPFRQCLKRYVSRLKFGCSTLCVCATHLVQAEVLFFVGQGWVCVQRI